MTHVLGSWHELARVLGFELLHFCPVEGHTAKGPATFCDTTDAQVDLLITDSWPTEFVQAQWSLRLNCQRCSP